jgi:hypothetical protein
MNSYIDKFMLSLMKNCYTKLSADMDDSNSQSVVLICKTEWNEVEFQNYLHNKLTERVDELTDKYDMFEFGYELDEREGGKLYIANIEWNEAPDNE